MNNIRFADVLGVLTIVAELQDITTLIEKKPSRNFGLRINAEKTKMIMTEKFTERQGSFIRTHRHKSAGIDDGNDDTCSRTITASFVRTY